MCGGLYRHVRDQVHRRRWRRPLPERACPRLRRRLGESDHNLIHASAWNYAASGYPKAGDALLPDSSHAERASTAAWHET